MLSGLLTNLFFSSFEIAYFLGGGRIHKFCCFATLFCLSLTNDYYCYVVVLLISLEYKTVGIL